MNQNSDLMCQKICLLILEQIPLKNYIRLRNKHREIKSWCDSNLKNVYNRVMHRDIRMDTIPEQLTLEFDTNIDRTTNWVKKC